MEIHSQESGDRSVGDLMDEMFPDETPAKAPRSATEAGYRRKRREREMSALIVALVGRRWNELVAIRKTLDENRERMRLRKGRRLRGTAKGRP